MEFLSTGLLLLLLASTSNAETFTAGVVHVSDQCQTTEVDAKTCKSNHTDYCNVADGAIRTFGVIIPGVSHELQIEHTLADTSMCAVEAANNLLNRKACALILLGNQDARMGDVFSFATSIRIPRIYINPHRIPGNQPAETRGLNFYMRPNTRDLNVMMTDIVDAYGWKTVAILYDGVYDIEGAEEILARVTQRGIRLGAFLIPKNPSASDLEAVLLKIKQSGIKKIVLHSEVNVIDSVFQQAVHLVMLNPHFHWMITNLVRSELDLSQYRRTNARITTFRLAGGYEGLEALSEELTTYEALVVDSVGMLIKGIENFPEDTNQDNCRDTLIRELTDGMEFGGRAFGPDGYLTKFSIDISEFKNGILQSVGNWTPTEGARLADNMYYDDRPLPFAAHKMFHIETYTQGVFVNFTENSKAKGLTGNDVFEGYLIDVIKTIATNLKFKFDLTVARVGNVENLIGASLVEGASKPKDMGLILTPLNYSSQVDITVSVLNLGYTVLWKKPKTKAVDVITLLTPLQNFTWLYILAVYACVTLAFYGINKFDPFEWGLYNRRQGREEDGDELVDPYGGRNSPWFVYRALVLQGMEKVPRSYGGKLVAAGWLMFAVTLVTYYIATYAGLLVACSAMQIHGMEDLHHRKDVAYGINKFLPPVGSFFETFDKVQDEDFKAFKEMRDFIYDNRVDVVVPTDNTGVEKVQKGVFLSVPGTYSQTQWKPYSFITHSKIQFFAQDQCQLETAGNYFFPYGLGLAFPKGSIFHNEFTEEILRLQEEGVLEELQNKWMTVTYDSCNCNGDDPLGTRAIAPENLTVVFGGMGVAMGVAIFVAVVEFLWFFHKRDKEFEKLNPQKTPDQKPGRRSSASIAFRRLSSLFRKPSKSSVEALRPQKGTTGSPFLDRNSPPFINPSAPRGPLPYRGTLPRDRMAVSVIPMDNFANKPAQNGRGIQMTSSPPAATSGDPNMADGDDVDSAGFGMHGARSNDTGLGESPPLEDDMSAPGKALSYTVNVHRSARGDIIRPPPDPPVEFAL
ncbi:glutamate receptor ionotropic, kainate 2-like [Branchiostoma lanceolatum]|uniref:glutamate receptor ionotropic, kainate 2-like n=1 Tax=Branchiostoma lanceolatum TaxID=7740 RepID=UPI003456E1EE